MEGIFKGLGLTEETANEMLNTLKSIDGTLKRIEQNCNYGKQGCIDVEIRLDGKTLARVTRKAPCGNDQEDTLDSEKQFCKWVENFNRYITERNRRFPINPA